MVKKNKAYFIYVAVLALLLIFPMAMPSSFHMDETRDPLFDKIPEVVGEWKGTDVELDERTYEILETRNVLSRNYEASDGKKVHLLLVGSFKDRRVAHPPEVCYISSNYSIVESAKRSINLSSGLTIAFNEFIAKNERRKDAFENVLYVYKVGSRYTTNYYAQQLLFAWDKIARRNSRVLLIRLSGSDKSVFERFLGQILPLLD